MNWSALATSSSVESQEQKRAALLERALIEGSGLLSRGSHNEAGHIQECRPAGSGSPSLAQRTGLLTHSQRSTTAPDKVYFQHIVKGQSARKSEVQLEDTTAAAASSKLPPQRQESSHLLRPDTQALPKGVANIPKEKWSMRQTPNTAVDTVCTSDGNMLQNPTWQSLVAASDSHDRSAGNAQPDKTFAHGGAGQWLADTLQGQEAHSGLLLHDHERPAILLRLPDGAAQCPGQP
ncbi:hypothetical protein ABBQ38_009305 [Trebouxia sp. C0009 RCD-2024]